MFSNLLSKRRRRDDADTFESLVAPHVEQLYRLAYRYTGNQADAEDLVQDLLVKLFPRLDELRKVEQLRPWLAKSLYYLYVDRYRARKRNPVEFGHDHQAEESHDIHRHGELTPSRQDTIRDLQRAIDQLGDDHRILIMMHDVESYTLAELEKILDTPVGTLKSRLHRGRAKLRKILEREESPGPERAEAGTP